MNWATIIALIALAFSITCFVLFVMDAWRKPPPEEAAEQVRSKVMAEARAAPSLDPRILGELAKALAAAFAKIGPGLVALIGAVLFLLLSGEAAGVYNLTGSACENAADPDTPEANEADGNGATNESDDADANGADAGNAADGADSNGAENET